MKLYDGALWLSGHVGQVDGEEFFTPPQVRQALSRHGPRALTAYINSGGGFVSDGIEIHNLLKAHSKPVTIVVDGMAASIASVIAMAGDEIVIRRGSMMMIHDPSLAVNGTAKEFERSAEMLHTMANEMATIYAARAKRPIEKIRALMIAETWFSPEQAVREGFADRVDTVGARVAASFPYSRVYARAPQSLQSVERRLVLRGLVQRFNERHDAKPRSTTAASSASPSNAQLLPPTSGRGLLEYLVCRRQKRGAPT